MGKQTNETEKLDFTLDIYTNSFQTKPSMTDMNNMCILEQISGK